MDTGTQFIDAVASELVRDDLASSGADKAVSQRALNDTLRDILNRHPFSWRVVYPPISVPCIVGQVEYDIQALSSITIQDIFSIIIDTGASDTRPMKEISLIEFTKKWANVSYIGNSTPSRYARIDMYKFVSAPTSSSAAYSFKIYYTPEFVDITVFGNPVTQIIPRMSEVLKLGMLSRLYRHLQEFERAGSLYSIFEAQIKILIQEDKENPNLDFTFSGTSMASSGANPWQTPFVQEDGSN